MAKPGRKRKTGPRTESGRLSRAAVDVTESAAPSRVRRLRDAALASMAAQEWGSEFGRLYLSEAISDTQYSAGRKYWLLCEAYDRLSQFADPPEEFEDIRETMLTARAAVRAAGSDKIDVLVSIIERDETTAGTIRLLRLKDALQVLIDLWGLEPKPYIRAVRT